MKYVRLLQIILLGNFMIDIILFFIFFSGEFLFFKSFFVTIISFHTTLDLAEGSHP